MSKWLHRTVLGIGLASLFSDVGHEMATSTMPALLASIGASSATLGLIEGLSSKQRVLAGGYALAVIPAVALLVPGDSYPKFAVVFALSGIYMGFWETVESATAATLLPEATRGAGFGVLATVNGVGDVAASVIVGGLSVASPVVAMAFVIVTSLGGAAVIASTRYREPEGASA